MECNTDSNLISNRVWIDGFIDDANKISETLIILTQAYGPDKEFDIRLHYPDYNAVVLEITNTYKLCSCSKAAINIMASGHGNVFCIIGRLWW